MGSKRGGAAEAMGTLGELMEAEWLLVEVAWLHEVPARRRALQDWLPQPKRCARYALAA